MNALARIRGPRLRFKLMLLAAALLVVPWLAYLQLVEMESLLIQNQQNAQLLIARGITTALDNRTDLFDDLSVQFDEFEPLMVYPLERQVRLDGRSNDWTIDVEGTALFFSGPDQQKSEDLDGTFSVALGQRADQLVVFMQINDMERVYRGGYTELDKSDHVRIRYLDANGDINTISAVLFEQGGAVTAYRADETWRFAATGEPLDGFSGVAAETSSGLDIEFSLPLSMLGDRSGFTLAYVDVDDTTQPAIRSIVETVPDSGKEEYNLVLLRSSVLANIINGLGYTDFRISIFDAQHRIRADTGPLDPAAIQRSQSSRHEWGLHWLRPLLHPLVAGEKWRELTIEESNAISAGAVSSALEGEPTAVRLRSPAGAHIVMAAHPIRVNDQVLGAVAVEQDIDQILDFERTAIEQIAIVSLLAFVLALLATYAFSLRLAHRIRRLRRQAGEAIDESGRLRTDTLDADMTAGDEIGDLARTIDRMLARLQEHVSFLSRMPRTLRHEINNPLNAVSTSLENMESATDPERRQHYLESARRGVDRIAAIVHNLADAANLEESLTAEAETRAFDLNALLRNYVNNINSLHKSLSFVYRGLDSPAFVRVDDFRIEQLMDKLVDNAMDFHFPGTPIKVQLDLMGDRVQIAVANRGAPFAKSGGALFDPMVTAREKPGSLHFGLGLYVVRAIAEFHGGSAKAFNLADGSGVVVTVRLPIARIESPVAPRAHPLPTPESA